MLRGSNPLSPHFIIMEIKIQKGVVNHIWRGDGWDVFKEQTIFTKTLKFKKPEYIKEDSIPTDYKVVKDWEANKQTIKILQEHGTL